MSAYTIAMTHQVKTITDAAVAAGVDFIVHLGVFGNGRSTDPHFAWHELVERYIEGSGVSWCHLHPHMFMENLFVTMRIMNDVLHWPMGDKPVGWIAGEDLSAVAAKVLTEGPDRHAGQNYFMSTEVLNGEQAARVLSEATGRSITAQRITPAQLAEAVAAGAIALAPHIEANYGASMLEWVRQTYEGDMAYSAITTDTVETLLGRPPTGLAEWARRHASRI